MKTPTLKRRPSIKSALAGLNRAVADLALVSEAEDAAFKRHTEAAEAARVAAELAKSERNRADAIRANLTGLMTPAEA